MAQSGFQEASLSVLAPGSTGLIISTVTWIITFILITDIMAQFQRAARRPEQAGMAIPTDSMAMKSAMATVTWAAADTKLVSFFKGLVEPYQ
jgi:hypothetical protein